MAVTMTAFFMSMDGRYITMSQGWRCEYAQGCADRYLLLGNCSCITLLPHIPGHMQYLHSPHPCGRLKIAPCIFCTPHIHVGRIPQ